MKLRKNMIADRSREMVRARTAAAMAGNRHSSASASPAAKDCSVPRARMREYTPSIHNDTWILKANRQYGSFGGRRPGRFGNSEDSMISSLRCQLRNSQQSVAKLLQ